MPSQTNRELYAELFATEEPVAFITGSVADRVGRKIAAHFQSSGFRVVVHSHSATETPASASGGKSNL